VLPILVLLLTVAFLNNSVFTKFDVDLNLVDELSVTWNPKDALGLKQVLMIPQELSRQEQNLRDRLSYLGVEDFTRDLDELDLGQ